MPLTPENRTETASDFPKLMLDKGERARILLIEPEPWFAYTHTLRAPVIGADQKPKMETVTNRDGESRQEMEMEFKGRHLCLGDYEALADKGTDADNCPECRASIDSGGAIPPPEQRFAVNVVRYACRPGTFDVQEPFQVSVLAWTFGEKVKNKLIQKKTEWGDLLRHDLLLGPCEVKQFQKYDIEVGQHAAWLSDATVEGQKTVPGPRGLLVTEAYNKQKAKDLEMLIGRKVTAMQMEEDLAVVLRRWSIAKGSPAQPDTPSAGEMAAAIDIGSLLGEGSVAEAAAPAPVELPVEVPTPAAEDAGSGPAGAVAPAAATEPEVAGELDLDALLQGITPANPVN